MKWSGYKPVFHIYVIFFILLVGTFATGFGMILYNITIQMPDGRKEISKWPIDFTEEFSGYLAFDNGTPRITQAGQELLKKNSLWLQILDTNGDEIQSSGKPQDIPKHYSPSDLLKSYQFGSGDYSIFFSKVQSDDKEWTYLIGFPVHISKVTMYVNGNRFATLKPIFWFMLCIVLILLILSTFIYSCKITRQMERMRKSIRDIAARSYVPVSGGSSFRDVYQELNTLHSEIRSTDEAREKTERQREEWIANITHDLKTPLSPIRGYAELVSASDTEMEADKIRKYGGIILKNTAYAEELINDLKLTYQLRNGMLPLKRRRQNLVRFVKELVIDLLNNPEYEQRDISFYCNAQDIELSFDAAYLKRALDNLLVNAMVHNGKDTAVSVTINPVEPVEIRIQDNGRGMTGEELENLFTRYYRGENTAAKPEGSGLGMAIAKQIIEMHGGRIAAESEPGKGTCIIIAFPVQGQE